MHSDLERRLARRRETVRRQQRRRRRLLLGSLLLSVLIAGGILLASGRSGTGSQPGSGSTTPQKPGSPKPAAKTDAAVPPAGPGWKKHTGPVPILMYHVIGSPAGEVTYPDLFLDTTDFQDQVGWLKENGYTAVTLSRVQDAWYDGATLPPKPVVLSFDDGYLGQYLDAMPILKRAGWPGLLNLKAEGSDLSTKEVQKMIAAGWEVGSHSITHPDLRNLSGAALTAEVAGSRKRLERDLGVKIENFCYPAGMYDDEAISAVRAAGYRGATTVNRGLGKKSMPFELNRIRVDRGDGAAALALKLGSAGA